MSNISSLLQESQGQWAQQKQETAKYVAKWEKTGLLEGLKGEYDRHNTAILLENQAKQLINEANATSTTAGKEDWNGVALPLVRRIFAEISAKEFVSVQPMNLPSGLVFWLDFKYAQAFGGFNDGESIYGSNGTSAATDFTKGLYDGPGREGYTLKAVSAGTADADKPNDGEATFDFSGSTNVDTDLLMSAYYLTGSANVQDATVVRAKSVSGTVVTFDAPVIDGTNVQVYYYQKPADAGDRGDFEAQHTPPTAGGTALEEVNLNIPELEVALEQEALIAKTRKLKVVWTPEFAQDLNAYHSIDAEAELTSMLSEYISMEIDLEILQMIHANAGHSSTWYANPPADDKANANVYASGSIWAYQLGSFNATLGFEIQKVSNKIHRATMRGGANFMVVAPDVATILETIPGFQVNTDGNSDDFAAGVERIGSFANRYKVYKNPYWNSDDIIIGFRGNQFLETGAVYAPYIPLIMTPLVYDPSNFTPRKGVMTRYAKKVVRKDFFGKISVANKDSLGL